MALILAVTTGSAATLALAYWYAASGPSVVTASARPGYAAQGIPAGELRTALNNFDRKMLRPASARTLAERQISTDPQELILNSLRRKFDRPVTDDAQA